jgi:cell wall-associated NlpC family hydrolase
MIPNGDLLLRGGAAALVLLLQGCAGSGRYAGFDIPDGPRGEVVMAALDERGTRYEYGGASPGRALDCSGLTLHAYRAAGVRIPRVSEAQLRAARPVRPSRARPGDLVFFRTKGGYHVGLMVDANRFVHASTSKREVRVSSLASPYWREHLIGAGTYLD